MALDRKIVVDLGLRDGEVCGDWDSTRASVRDENGVDVGFVELNDGRKVVIWLRASDTVRAELIQATADLLAARNELYRRQPGHELVPLADRALASLLSPSMIVTVPS